MSSERRLVLVTSQLFDQDDAESAGLLRRHGLEIRLAPKLGPRTPQELASLLQGVSAAIVSTDPFDRSVFPAAPELRVVARLGVGFDTIDLDAATEAGVVVTTTRGALEGTVADHTIALMLGLLRRTAQNDASMRRGEWVRGAGLSGWDLHGSTVGLVGYGTIGRIIARRLSGFDTEILVSDPFVQPEPGIQLVGLEELLRRAQVVSLHAPLTPATRGMIGAAELRLMRPDAILLNLARGGIVDEDRLEEALIAGRIRGAALDVFEREPPDLTRPLFQLPNVLLSPHVAGFSEASIRNMLRQASRSVVAVLSGQRAEHVVNPG